MTLISDLWLWKPFQQWALAWWLLVSSISGTAALTDERSPHTSCWTHNGRDRPTRNWLRWRSHQHHRDDFYRRRINYRSTVRRRLVYSLVTVRWHAASSWDNRRLRCFVLVVNTTLNVVVVRPRLSVFVSLIMSLSLSVSVCVFSVMSFTRLFEYGVGGVTMMMTMLDVRHSVGRVLFGRRRREVTWSLCDDVIVASSQFDVIRGHQQLHSAKPHLSHS